MDEMNAVRAEFRKIYPPPTAARAAAHQRAVGELAEKYPGQFVAYIDTWTGDALDRRVVAVSDDAVEFRDKLLALAPEARGRVEMTRLPERDVIECPSVWFSDEDVIEVS